MTVDFHAVGDGYEPVLALPTNPALRDWPWELFRATVRGFVDEWVLDADIAARDADLRSGVAGVLTAFWSHPTTAEAAVWGEYIYEDDILGASHNSLAKAIGVRDFIGKAGRGYEGKRLWLSGSVQISPPGIRPFARAGLWINEGRQLQEGPAAFLPAKWRRRAHLLRLAAQTRGIRVKPR
jgi:hypothetical protein